MKQNKKEALKNNWIPINERFPEPDTYILVSFSNSFATDIGRYENDEEGGAFYPAYMDRSYSALGFFVNAWMPLPEPYKCDTMDSYEYAEECSDYVEEDK